MPEIITIEDLAAVNRSRNYEPISEVFKFLGKKLTKTLPLEEILSQPATEPTEEQREWAVDLALSGETGAMTKAIHGAAPGKNLFSRFSKDFIGTGEGGAARGHGFYFSDIRDIPEVYAKHGLEYTNYFTYKGKTYSKLSDITSDKHTQRLIAESLFKGRQTSPTNPKEGALKHLESISPVSDTKEAKSILSEISDIRKGDPGYIYNVTLHPHKEQENWLEWDKSLTKEQINKILGKSFNNAKFKGHNPSYKGEAFKEGMTGGELYHQIENQLGSQKETSEFLDRAGIDGIRFEAGSIMGIKPKVKEKSLSNLSDEQLVNAFAGEEQSRNMIDPKTAKFLNLEESGKLLRHELKFKQDRTNRMYESAKRLGYIPETYNYVIFNPEHIQINQIEDITGKVVKSFTP